MKARARHILVDSEEQANQLVEDINAKEVSFGDMARMHSKCPSNRKGGDLGVFNPGQMVKPFNDVVFEGDTSKLHVVKTQFGWHVVDILERTE